MPNLSRRTIDDPAMEAARLLARLSIMLLFIISQVAPILARQTIYILLPIGAALLLLSASLAPDSRRLGQIVALALKPTTLAALFFVGWTGLSLAWTPFGSGPAERFAKSAATLALVAAACALLPAAHQDLQSQSSADRHRRRGRGAARRRAHRASAGAAGRSRQRSAAARRPRPRLGAVARARRAGAAGAVDLGRRSSPRRPSPPARSPARPPRFRR